MKKLQLVAINVAFVMLVTVGCTSGGGDDLIPDPPTVHASGANKTMRAFRSDKELSAFLRDLAEKQEKVRARYANHSLSLPFGAPTKSAPVPAAPAAQADQSAQSETKEESITNVQHAGVDEGSIVKLHGNHLVVLRRGRLFTVAIGSNALAPISCVDAFGPDIDPSGTWYDEMLVSQDTVVVIGYSYQRGGTEVGLFRIDPAGKLAYQSTYHLRSNDYYSSRNYASRLIGSKLIFYTPLYLYPRDPYEAFPAVRKWHKGATDAEFHRILPATQVYRAEGSFDLISSSALHTVTTCDLSSGDFDCKATSVIGPPGRVFYVSPQAVYVWVTGPMYHPANSKDGTMANSMVYRMPLDGSSPTAVAVNGSPVDQFSFLESEDGYLNVLVRSAGYGDGMWSAEGAAGGMALLRLPLERFSDGSEAPPSSAYTKLPAPQGYAFQNRFVGDYLLYGAGSGWGDPQQTEKSTLFAVRWSNGDLHEVTLTHGIDRIEQMGSAAVVVGTDGDDLHFSSISLGTSPAEESEYIRKGASQGELRSHGFFYKPDSADSGMLGLPISMPGRPGYRHLFDESAAILFLRNNSLHLHDVGELDAQPDKAIDDACRASCVDWYGNAQPLFVRGRIFALLGYELVEGRLEEGRIYEMRRVNYAPQSLSAEGRPAASLPVN